MTTADDARKTLADLLPKFRFAMVTTVDAEGKLTSRPLTVQEHEFDGDLWFVVSRESSVVAETAVRPGVGVALTSNDAWVSLAGDAEVVDDRGRLRQYWSPALDAWFPDGPTDPNVTLLKINAVSGEYWSSAGGAVASLIGYVKAKLTGDTYDGRNASVEL
ncbi:general stress protein 26 [Microbacterium marinum]|uniref:General stress protein 26 n=1 Tax=Microbacterium marinum TaxID=421115 RepID=A0A7W7BPF6_9MICO|nr:pyridoxamine 5'-phosphate oxidase family protein [Microbacterium marinum]MBB4666433.1 general stress protein 26 [Microbacterium marinum]